jgi:peptidoglycan-associated lipoprotein
MHKVWMGIMVPCLATMILAGCETFGSRDDEAAAEVEDRGEVDAGAQPHGVPDSGRFRGAELDDPDSPLAVRVIYFDYDSDQVRAEFREAVQAHASYLASNSSVAVTLEGHADERGSREYNLALGERRSNAVRRQMVLLGASADQIRVVSYGEERPAAEGHDESAWSLNRRVEILY